MISIIVPVIYRPDLTRVCIDSILAYTKDFELIIVQEGEDKEIRELILSYGDKVKYLNNPIPKGYAGALNTGLKIATGDYYCFMNNDIVAVPNWMDEMLKAFEDKERNIGLVTPTFWGTGDRQSVDWNDGRQFDYVIDPLSVIGVCYLFKKEVIEKIGEWDESFGHGGEDFDMVIRMQNHGWNVAIARKSFIYHYGGASTRIVFDNDYIKVRDNQMRKIEQLEQKHGIDLKGRFIKNN